jgi:hypothetical protein
VGTRRLAVGVERDGYCYKDPREVVERSPFFRVVATDDDAVLTLRSLTPSELVTPAPARSTA